MESRSRIELLSRVVTATRVMWSLRAKRTRKGGGCTLLKYTVFGLQEMDRMFVF